MAPLLVVHGTANNSPWLENCFQKASGIKVVGRHKLGEGYKEIWKDLASPLSTIQCIIKKWKVYGTTNTFPTSGHVSKLDDLSQEDINKRSYQESKGNVEVLKAFMAGTGQSVPVLYIFYSVIVFNL